MSETPYSPQCFFAHTFPGDCDTSRWELLTQHLENVSRLAELFATEFRAGEWGRLAGRWHDLGKYSVAFLENLQLTRKLMEVYLNDKQVRRDLSAALNRCGDVVMKEGHITDARSLFLEANGIVQELLEADPENRRYCRDAAKTEIRLGQLEQADGDTTAAKVLFSKAEKRLLSLIEIDRIVADNHLLLAEALWGLAGSQPTRQRKQTLKRIQTIFAEQHQRNSYFYPAVAEIELAVDKELKGGKPRTATAPRKKTTKRTRKK